MYTVIVLKSNNYLFFIVSSVFEIQSIMLGFIVFEKITSHEIDSNKKKNNNKNKLSYVLQGKSLYFG